MLWYNFSTYNTYGLIPKYFYEKRMRPSDNHNRRPDAWVDAQIVRTEVAPVSAESEVLWVLETELLAYIIQKEMLEKIVLDP